MKKILFLMLFLAAASPFLCSCDDDDFLEEKPKTIYTKGNAFEKASQVDAVLVKAYNKFNQMNAFANSFITMFGGNGGDPAANFLHGEGSDVLGPTGGASAVNTSFSNYWALQTNNPNFLTAWNSIYQLASYANLAMYGMTQVKGLSESDAKYLEAQAKFFRGWAYLRLAEMFGGVPIVKEFSEELKFDYGRATREETYSFAIEDLTASAENLPRFPSQSGRVSQGIAKHFLAEAYLGRGIETGSKADFDSATKAADEVIADHPLMTKRFGSRSEGGVQPAGIPDNGVPRYLPDANPYFDLFIAGNYAYSASGNTESLMIYEQPLYEKQSIYGGAMIANAITIGPAFRDLSWNAALAAEHAQIGTSASPWMGNIDSTRFPGAQLGLHLTGSWGLIGAMDYSDEDVWEGDFAIDDRNSQLVRYNPVVMNQDSPYYLQTVTKDQLAQPASLSRVSCKVTTWDIWGWNLDHCSAYGVPFVNQYGRDWYIARSAETYLIRAEAAFRAGDSESAARDLNTVRSRANATKMYSAGEVTLYAILDERARELAWEEMRWPTLLRMGGGGSNDVMHSQLEKHSFGTEDVGTLAGQSFPAWTLFPIPYDVINLNKGAVIEQNPGWN